MKIERVGQEIRITCSPEAAIDLGDLAAYKAKVLRDANKGTATRWEALHNALEEASEPTRVWHIVF